MSGQTELPPLCVDLDDTLIRTDVLWECIVQLWRKPGVFVRALLALASRGKAGFKSILAEAIPIDPTALPWREEVLEYLRAQHAAGRTVVLATATHHLWAQPIADHLGLFIRVFATDGAVNLSSISKRDALTSAYGPSGFDYIGDHIKDLPIFSAAREALLVNPSATLQARVSAQGNLGQIFRDPPFDVHLLARALRLHQWAKNALLAVPLLSAHLVFNLQAWINLALAFLGFGLVASATYLINDLVDLHSDRRHPRKRLRPLASGRLSIRTGLCLALGLGIIGFVLSYILLPFGFGAYLVAYVLITLGYSLYLKRKLLIDALTLAMLYTLRILAGGAATAIVVSEWLLMFSLFMFLSLAFLKRIIELRGATGETRIPGRGYSAVDLETVRVIGVTSGMMAVLVFAMYISSPAVSLLYRSPQILWLLSPLLIYWIARIWFLAARDEVDHDPVVFALMDARSYGVGACAALILLFAKLSTIRTHW
ncbi:MAG: UbiA family prenyltransferase [Steroidobacteraceae bacterium]